MYFSEIVVWFESDTLFPKWSITYLEIQKVELRYALYHS